METKTAQKLQPSFVQLVALLWFSLLSYWYQLFYIFKIYIMNSISTAA